MASTRLNTSYTTKVNNRVFNMIDNYIYMYHVDEFIVLPAYPDQVRDSIAPSYNSTAILGRSAPIYSYQHSGPRSMQFIFTLHRDLMYQINHNISNVDVENPDDYVDIMIRYIQACALPTYGESTKLVNPPMVAVRLGDDIFIKGVVKGSVGITYGLPILRNGKYAKIQLAFEVEEVDPFDARTVMTQGSFRGLSTTLEEKAYKAGVGSKPAKL